MQQGARYDLIIPQGSYFEFIFTWKDESNNPINNTGYTVKLQATDIATGDLVVDLNIVSGITLGGATGVVTAYMSDAATAALNFDTARYNLEVIAPNGRGKRLLYGYLTLSQDIEP